MILTRYSLFGLIILIDALTAVGFIWKSDALYGVGLFIDSVRFRIMGFIHLLTRLLNLGFTVVLTHSIYASLWIYKADLVLCVDYCHDSIFSSVFVTWTGMLIISGFTTTFWRENFHLG